MKHYRASSKNRVVVDTNVWISGIVFGGKPEQVLRRLLDGAADLIISEELIAELRQKMTQKFPDYLTRFNKIEASVREDVELVKPDKFLAPVCRDPDDDKFIETALAGGANYIVSGDKDLLDIGKYQNIRIIKPAEFLKLLN